MRPELSEEVMDLLRCPETKQPLRFATAEELETFGFSPEGDGFITEDEEHFFPVKDGFPFLKIEDRISREPGS